ncbi:NAD-dependent epimerase/dehydratase family protein, partial [Planctomycetota bacterium]|nr:NAD-dependent epimerase/dehydratase family protein [Planctomycetota bacterium]
MKVLLLGGTGFVGSHTLRAFAKAGHEVACLVRPTSPRDVLAGLDVEFVPGDLRDQASLEAAFKGRDVVVHSAGVMSQWERDQQTLYDVNVLGTRRVVRACLKAEVQRLVYTGSVGIYAGCREPIPVTEEGSPDTSRFHSFHITSMCLAEHEVTKGMAQGLDAVMLHPSFCFGTGDRHLHSSWLLVILAFTRLALVPPGGLNAVNVLDVARAHVLAAELAPKNQSYLIGGENLTNVALAEMAKECLDLKAGLTLAV